MILKYVHFLFILTQQILNSLAHPSLIILFDKQSKTNDMKLTNSISDHYSAWPSKSEGKSFHSCTFLNLHNSGNIYIYIYPTKF